MKKNNISLNKNVDYLVDDLLTHQNKYNLKIYKDEVGANIIDAGIEVSGSIEAGLKISEICLGGMANVTINHQNYTDKITWSLNVYANNPVLSCLGSQYAGWSLNSDSFFSLGSGPARALAQREEIFNELNYTDKHSRTVIVLETNKVPPSEIIKKICNNCSIKYENLYVILTPTTSMPGNIQIVSRVLEVAIHKAHELKFPLDRIVDGIGNCPLPPISNDMITGMGRTNDAIIYGGTVFLTIKGSSDDAKELSQKLPSKNSKDFGKPFKTIFKEYKGDFYKIDGSLFSPAKVVINSYETGETFLGGKLNKDLLEKSFFNEV